MERKNKRVYSNTFDKKYFGQFSRIQKNYNEISKMKIGKRKFVTIDASLSANEIHEKIILSQRDPNQAFFNIKIWLRYKTYCLDIKQYLFKSVRRRLLFFLSVHRVI